MMQMNLFKNGNKLTDKENNLIVTKEEMGEREEER